jgi:peptidyl-prolyl cis-trans isomerase D
MLKLFRKGGPMQLLMGVIVAAIIVAFLFTFRGGLGGSTLGVETALAVVRDGKRNEVLMREYEAARGVATPQWDVPPSQLRAANFNGNVLDGLVERELLLQEAARLGLDASEEAVDANLRRGVAYFSYPIVKEQQLYGPWMELYGPTLFRILPVREPGSKKFDYEIYKRSVLSLTRLSPREFKEMQTKEVIADRVRSLVRERVRVSDAEAFLFFENQNTQATARYVPLNWEWFGRYIADISNAAVAEWAKQNQPAIDTAWEKAKESYTEGCALVADMVIEPKEGTDDFVNRVEGATKRLKTSENFEIVAREVGVGEVAWAGGDLKCADSFDDDVLKAAAQDLARGEVAGPIESADAQHMLRGAGKLKAGDVEKLGKEVISRQLASRAAAQKLATQFGDALRNAVAGGESLVDAATALTDKAAKGLPRKRRTAALDSDLRPKMQVTGSFTRAGDVVRNAAPGQKVGQRVMSLDKPDALLPDLVKTKSGLALVQLKSIDPATPEKFEIRKESTVNFLTAQKQREALANYIAALHVGSEVTLNPILAKKTDGAKKKAPPL